MKAYHAGWVIYYCELLGVAAFAVTGTLMAGRKSLDWFGVITISLVTALGGGALRDVLMAHYPIEWVSNENGFLVGVSASLGTMIWAKTLKTFNERVLLVADAFGLAVFTVTGTDMALQQNLPPSIAVIMGVATAVAGGVMRDVLCNEIPLVFRREVYASISILGAVAYITLLDLQISLEVASAIAIAFVFVSRIAAIRWKWMLPRFHVVD
ncbi:hypothetical protein D3C87_839580 [compost metagenome]|uniref:trimeric intracellular cation channel family protein n=1 Tax=Pseudomonas TaxID=286 RepID=UPI000BB3B644|nr:MULTISPECIES: trimeric intracellular cation channel family protein [Pseudomonas]PBJ07642.1 hypothetical protein BSF40_18370 [Pseudomonas sp. ACN5]VVQ23606.1 hypothetical protein PS934_05533 [Pseudomonas fluorescens]